MKPVHTKSFPHVLWSLFTVTCHGNKHRVQVLDVLVTSSDGVFGENALSCSCWNQSPSALQKYSRRVMVLLARWLHLINASSFCMAVCCLTKPASPRVIINSLPNLVLAELLLFPNSAASIPKCHLIVPELPTFHQHFMFPHEHCLLPNIFHGFKLCVCSQGRVLLVCLLFLSSQNYICHVVHAQQSFLERMNKIKKKFSFSLKIPK